MRILSEDLILLRTSELPFVKVTVAMEIAFRNYLKSLPDETVYRLDEHTETTDGARKVLAHLKKVALKEK